MATLLFGLDKHADANKCNGFLELDLEAFVNDERVQQEALSQIVEHLDDIELVAIVNNAAIQIIKDWQLLTMSDLRRSINVNAFAVVILAQLLFSLLERGSEDYQYRKHTLSTYKKRFSRLQYFKSGVRRRDPWFSYRNGWKSRC